MERTKKTEKQKPKSNSFLRNSAQGEELPDCRRQRWKHTKKQINRSKRAKELRQLIHWVTEIRERGARN